MADEVIEVEHPEWIIGIGDPGSATWKDQKFSDENRLRIRCHDVQILPCADQYTPPSKEFVEQIIGFARRHLGKNGLIHCYAGQSRSVGTALIVACVNNPEGIRGTTFQTRQLSGWANPNRVMIRLADDLLGMNGELIAAVHLMGRRIAKGVIGFSLYPYDALFCLWD
ncbi:MAG: hypothetical protein HWE34_00845 [Methylocystaceae bacterium]|nr:hypothetical protein [Methylocystaceae bacterium]